MVYRSNQEEMLKSIQEKRLQFDDSSKLQEIQTMVSEVSSLHDSLKVRICI